MCYENLIILGLFVVAQSVVLVGRSRYRSLVVSLGIFSVAPDRTMYPGVDSASESEYQVFLLR